MPVALGLFHAHARRNADLQQVDGVGQVPPDLIAAFAAAETDSRVLLGETVEEAVVREVEEETCIRASPLRLITPFDSIVRAEEDRIRFHYVLCEFLCEYVGGELEASTDASDATWARLDELEGMNVPSGTRRFIERVAREEGLLERSFIFPEAPE